VLHWEGRDGRLRIGIAFVGMTSLERYTIAGILSQQRRRRRTLPNI
jgi:hypothetical protein